MLVALLLLISFVYFQYRLGLSATLHFVHSLWGGEAAGVDWRKDFALCGHIGELYAFMNFFALRRGFYAVGNGATGGVFLNHLCGYPRAGSPAAKRLAYRAFCHHHNFRLVVARFECRQRTGDAQTRERCARVWVGSLISISASSNVPALSFV